MTHSEYEEFRRRTRTRSRGVFAAGFFLCARSRFPLYPEKARAQVHFPQLALQRLTGSVLTPKPPAAGAAGMARVSDKFYAGVVFLQVYCGHKGCLNLLDMLRPMPCSVAKLA